MRRRAGTCSSASGTIVAPEGIDGGDGRTGIPFGGRVIGIVTGFTAPESGGGGGGGGGGAGVDVCWSVASLCCGGAVDGGAVDSGCRRG